MAQDYNPLTADRTFAASYLTINSTDLANRTLNSGATAPASTVAYMLWVDTANNLLKQRNSTNTDWITLAQIGVTNGGLLSTDGGTMGGAIAMGGSKITGLGAPTAAGDAARKDELDLKAPLAAPALTGDATINQDPAGNDSLTRRSWTEGRYLKLAGGSMTALFNLFGDAVSALHAVTLQQLKTFVQFNTSTGHRHTGGDARRVLASDLNSGSEPEGRFLSADGTGNVEFRDAFTPVYPSSFLFDAAAANTSFRTEDVSALVGDMARAVYLKVRINTAGHVLIFREDGVGNDTLQMGLESSFSTGWLHWVKLSSLKKFQWRTDSLPVTVQIAVMGWM